MGWRRFVERRRSSYSTGGARVSSGNSRERPPASRDDPARGSRRAGGADRVGRSEVATALDLEERAAAGRGPAEHGPCGQPARA